MLAPWSPAARPHQPLHHSLLNPAGQVLPGCGASALFAKWERDAPMEGKSGGYKFLTDEWDMLPSEFCAQAATTSFLP